MVNGQIKPYSDGYKLTIHAERKGRRVQVDQWWPTKEEAQEAQTAALELVERVLWEGER